jgi:hypothetical protein
MDYSPILKEIERVVRVRHEPNSCLDVPLQHILDSRFTDEECYPWAGKNTVSLFMQMLYRKYPTEYKKKLLQWITHVAGAWITSASELRMMLHHWIKTKMEEYRESMGWDEPESEDDHPELSRLGDFGIRRSFHRFRSER